MAMIGRGLFVVDAWDFAPNGVGPTGRRRYCGDRDVPTIVRTMIERGPPTLRCLFVRGKVHLLEGSHRAYAAAYLGYVIRLEVIDTPTNHRARLEGLFGADRREGDYIQGRVCDLLNRNLKGGFLYGGDHYWVPYARWCIGPLRTPLCL